MINLMNKVSSYHDDSIKLAKELTHGSKSLSINQSALDEIIVKSKIRFVSNGAI